MNTDINKPLKDNDESGISFHSSYVPLERPDLGEWMEKHHVSGQIMSIPSALTKAIEYEQLKTELYERA
ncbi:hypothetical protein BPT24_247 [Tenacibaculum phage pT24]|uniref:Uncharacterized protein n=1 Tax=Tenacibaculum phage pT24 TaxID=1880590 RepID=A0A1B4XX40_9CAUD|nr:hypothetical protein HYP10_gp281 [Tenacibaculum phage pT24]BAV39367.1 hypothetical protein BPT24_247 [Tenacibaculum phage pT24]